MRRTRHVFLVFLSAILSAGCSPSGSITTQSGGTASGKGAVTLGPGELNQVFVARKTLPPGWHIDVTAINGRLAFKPDNNSDHGATGQSITTKSGTGATERTPAFVTPEAREILNRRAPAS